jgi:hypothetical protein
MAVRYPRLPFSPLAAPPLLPHFPFAAPAPPLSTGPLGIGPSGPPLLPGWSPQAPFVVPHPLTGQPLALPPWLHPGAFSPGGPLHPAGPLPSWNPAAPPSISVGPGYAAGPYIGTLPPPAPPPNPGFAFPLARMGGPFAIAG